MTIKANLIPNSPQYPCEFCVYSKGTEIALEWPNFYSSLLCVSSPHSWLLPELTSGPMGRQTPTLSSAESSAGLLKKSQTVATTRSTLTKSLIVKGRKSKPIPEASLLTTGRPPPCHGASSLTLDS
ncbi:unnamed protein product, partial [Allacma fusca]